ncbi:stage II sporulation protein M [Mycetocola reblochoni]|uniref:stage II sporulation protein M n=1 Tax=Mycetocola reblochoni TaxID=331618 RepID=UPI0015C63E4E|nr:stage II sporulation protein M [Mycetocola reblochoni]
MAGLGQTGRAITRDAILASGTILTLVAALSFLRADSGWLRRSVESLALFGSDPSLMTDGSFLAILIRNAGVAAFLFSGVVTAGVTTLAALVLTAFAIGTSMALVQSASGWIRLLGDVAWYAPIEFASLAVVGAAGLVPLLSALRAGAGDSEERQPRRGPLHRYLAALPAALRLGVLGFVGIVIGAAVESAVIALR